MHQITPGIVPDFRKVEKWLWEEFIPELFRDTKGEISGHGVTMMNVKQAVPELPDMNMSAWRTGLPQRWLQKKWCYSTGTYIVLIQGAGQVIDILVGGDKIPELHLIFASDELVYG